MSAFGSAQYGNIEPKKAIDYWASKKPTIKDEWVTLSERERDRAFTAANIMEANKLQQVYNIIDDSIKNGEPVKTAKDKILAVADITDAQAETIVRTNIASAYSAGRFQEMTAVSKYRPYWKYLSIDDDSTRASHLALNGVVYPADDPFWTVNFPPNGYRCRCDTASLSERQVRAQGIDVVRTKDKPFVVNKAFARNPLDLYAPVLDKYSPQVRQKYIENAVNYANGDEQKLLKLLEKKDAELSKIIAQTNRWTSPKHLEYFVHRSLELEHAKGEVSYMGNLPYKVTSFLKTKNKEPRLSMVVLTDRRVKHIFRDKKQEINQIVTVDEILSIPKKLKAKDTRWFYDDEKENVIMAFIRNDKEWIKVAIELDENIDKTRVCNIVTAAKIDPNNFNELKLKEIK